MITVFYNDVNENNTMFEDNEALILSDRREFVHNVGVLASQTREGVKEIQLLVKGGCEIARIYYKKDNFTRDVNITSDSFSAIVQDIFRNL